MEITIKTSKKQIKEIRQRCQTLAKAYKTSDACDHCIHSDGSCYLLHEAFIELRDYAYDPEYYTDEDIDNILKRLEKPLIIV